MVALLLGCIWVSGDELATRQDELRPVDTDVADDTGTSPDDTGGSDADGDSYIDVADGGSDCDDNDASVNPGAPERLGDDTDSDCDGAADGVQLAQFSLPTLSGVLGPRLSWDGATLWLGLAAESSPDGYDALYAASFGSDAGSPGDPTLLTAPEDGGALGDAFDFAADEQRRVWATASYDGDRRLLIDGADADRYGYLALEGGAATNPFSQLQISLEGGSIRALGCAPDTVWVAEMTAESLLEVGEPDATVIQSDLDLFSVCEISPDGYLLARSSGESGVYTARDGELQLAEPLGQLSLLDVALDTAGVWSFEARSEIGVGLWLDRGDEETLLALSAPPEKIDLTGEEDGDAYLCGVAGGEARLYYSAAGGALFEVELEPGTPVDDCAIGSAGAGQIALAFRSGDQILRGLFYSL